ncbi:MAG: glycoside hydrolase [Anaerolineae bacterium]|nr:glycoside hydrolase [Anaerolineae bacterium]
MTITPLAQDHVVLYESPSPEDIYLGSPGLARMPNGRLVATFDFFGKGTDRLPEPRMLRAFTNTYHQGKVFTSDDHGQTWTHKVDFPFLHARPFVAGNSLYVLGLCNDLYVIGSQDGGETWTEPQALTGYLDWTGAASNVHYVNACVYLAIEKRLDRNVQGWQVANIAPVVLRGRVSDDLTKPENWTLASDLVFMDAVNSDDLKHVGIPFLESDRHKMTYPAPKRGMAPIGWLETQVVQITDPDHYWFDPSGRTLHLWARANTGGTGYAAIAKVVEEGDEPGTGPMTTMLETAPSGKSIVFVPCPGGQMKFHILYDAPSRCYWLLSTQSINSMIRADRLPDNRYGLPNNERRRLALHYSYNMIDWCFAGLVAVGDSEKEARHYASMIIDGDDLHVLSRSGDARAHDAHNGNLITFHTVSQFRKLIY